MCSLHSYARLMKELEELSLSYRRQYFRSLEQRHAGDRGQMARAAEISRTELEAILEEIGYSDWRRLGV